MSETVTSPCPAIFIHNDGSPVRVMNGVFLPNYSDMPFCTPKESLPETLGTYGPTLQRLSAKELYESDLVERFRRSSTSLAKVLCFIGRATRSDAEAVASCD